MEVLSLKEESKNHPAEEDALRELRQVIARLRGEGGCPWDREQTHASLRTALIEECWEAIDAIEASDDANLAEELGDILLVVLMHMRIAEERDAFQFSAVVANTTEKLIRRHPHVFGDKKVENAAEVLVQWDEIKRREKSERKTVWDGIPQTFPALLRAQKIQKKAAKEGFDWPEWTSVLDKLEEEIKEVREAVEGKRPDDIEEELGDVLFTVVNLCRKLQCNAEIALNRTTQKFQRRFQQVTSQVAVNGQSVKDLSLSALDAIWNKVKEDERRK